MSIPTTEGITTGKATTGKLTTDFPTTEEFKSETTTIGNVYETIGIISTLKLKWARYCALPLVVKGGPYGP